MIIGLWHVGSGMGDQCFAYLAARVRAEDLGVPFGMIGEFKGASFMNIDRGEPVNLKYHIEMPSGAIVIDEPHKLFKVDTPYFNPEFNFIADDTIIDATGAQDEKYWGHRLEDIGKWLSPKGSAKFDDLEKELCIINFRGGEFTAIPELFLPKTYYEQAMSIMQSKYPEVTFEVHTDDIETAKEYFPGLTIYQDIQLNWEAVRYAKHLIISNSAFAIIPALLNGNVTEVIAPFGWNARNASLTKWMGRPMNYYKKFTYI